jgi:hypothetical protein
MIYSGRSSPCLLSFRGELKNAILAQRRFPALPSPTASKFSPPIMFSVSFNTTPVYHDSIQAHHCEKKLKKEIIKIARSAAGEE